MQIRKVLPLHFDNLGGFVGQKFLKCLLSKVAIDFDYRDDVVIVTVDVYSFEEAPGA